MCGTGIAIASWLYRYRERAVLLSWIVVWYHHREQAVLLSWTVVWYHVASRRYRYCVYAVEDCCGVKSAVVKPVVATVSIAPSSAVAVEPVVVAVSVAPLVVVAVVPVVMAVSVAPLVASP